MSEVQKDIIKRVYPTNDFNPFHVMDFLYNTHINLGVGTRILVVGYSERFTSHIGDGLRHAAMSRSLEVPKALDNIVKLHTGAVIEFLVAGDVYLNRQVFEEACDRSTHVALCNKFNSPEFLNIIRDQAATKVIQDFSQNNLKK